MNETEILSEKSETDDIVKSNNVWMLISCLAIGIFTDYLFYGKAIGISFPIFVMIFYLIFFCNSRKIMKFEFNFAWLLTVPIFLLSFTTFIYSNVYFTFINCFAVMVLIVSQTLLLTSNNKYDWYALGFIEDIIIGIFYRTLSHIKEPFLLISKAMHIKVKSSKIKCLSKILIGLLISIPLVVIIISLLASADKVFGNLVNSMPNIFENVNIHEFLFRTGFIIFMSITSFSYIWSIINTKIKKSEILYENQSGNHNWDSIIVTTVLSLINVIYIVFVIIQFTYLFGGVRPSGLTFAEYARRGFFELLLVTLINLCILLCDIIFTKRDSEILSRFTKFLDTVLIVCTIVMLVSAHVRMSLYEKAYGYTYLRVLTQAFMVFIFVLLITALLKVWRKDTKLIDAYIIFAIIFYVAINYLNIDAIVANNNISVYKKGTQNIDVQYLDILSYDSVPSLVKLMKSEKREISVKAENYLYLKKRELSKNTPWQSFNFSKYKAKRILSKYNLSYTNLDTIKNKNTNER